ncbi:type II toxin-antitoxin system VapB family antitoxin [Mycobacterium antarcticum]|uniref:type II toxin-antitoxin system VapB family antitoxin n=1 Tax=unclassified Mycolicibacterium TaxID=2636767 RepID=UPI0024E083D5|nr:MULTISPECIES: type II toxin-antitoxin system VapB family antitoxin [unclassified Mycolicibacterium]
MALNIKDPSVHEAVKQLAALTGESQSQAVAMAVNERLARLQQDDLAVRLLGIGHKTAQRMNSATEMLDHAELLYDDEGLPA